MPFSSVVASNFMSLFVSEIPVAMNLMPSIFRLPVVDFVTLIEPVFFLLVILAFTVTPSSVISNGYGVLSISYISGAAIS